MKPEIKAPTLGDVAKSAGVSLYTASVVLNGSRSNTRVSEATRQRIVEAAAELRYHPNLMARGLTNRRTHSLGVCFGVMMAHDTITNPYASHVLQGILAACSDLGYCVTLYTERWQDEATSAVRFRDGRCDGLIVIAPPTESDIVPALATLGLKLCAIAYPAETYGVNQVDVDNRRGIELAVSHLVELGHRRIAHIHGNADMASVPTRREAFVAAMARAGLPLYDHYIQAGSYDGMGIDEAIERLFALPDPPTALIAGNDTIAIAAMAACREREIRIPEQLSLVGFDGSLSGELVTPPLTTIKQPLHEIGATAAKLLIAEIIGKNDDARGHLLAPELVVRGSTGPPPTRCTM
ncbi:MAG TPA: LacI family DNA-binding transcriptional regulator [Chthonomonadaceae bacterium]|nr:LacI family DNA-binding transcriptional regulator [Chthonomonadaceae bacterium]